MRIAVVGSSIKVKELRTGSPAFIGGLRTNDKLISIWGQLTSYMPEGEVEYFLLEASFGEIKIGIERNIKLKKEKPFNKRYEDAIGGKLEIPIEGLTLVDVTTDGPGYAAGLRKGDLVVAINGTSTRYMPLKDAIRIMENPLDDTIRFSVRRDVTVWIK